MLAPRKPCAASTWLVDMGVRKGREQKETLQHDEGNKQNGAARSAFHVLRSQLTYRRRGHRWCANMIFKFSKVIFKFSEAADWEERAVVRCRRRVGPAQSLVIVISAMKSTNARCEVRDLLGMEDCDIAVGRTNQESVLMSPAYQKEITLFVTIN
jgi:hypothetical protein